MLRKFLIFICLGGFLFAEALTITAIEQTQKGAKISFNKNLPANAFKNFVLKSEGKIRYVYDINAQLAGAARALQYTQGVQIRIAQNTQDKVRLVINSNKELKVRTKTAAKTLEIEVEGISLQEDSVNIASLFDTPKTQKSTTSNTKNKTTQNPASQNITSKNTPKNSNPKTSTSQNKKTSQESFQTNTARKVIVIDPGHGGKDCGAMGVAKVCEKKIVLEVGKYLNTELKKRGYLVYMTRNTDKFIKLSSRTKFANDKNADLFVSIHANAVPDNKDKLQGVESYFLSTARSERAKKVAALENKDDTEVMNYFSKQSFLNTLNTQRIVASNKLAIDIQYGMLQSLKKGYGVIDGGVREGPFWVLVGAIMPSVLLEIGYMTHPKEGKNLNQSNFQKALAEGIANGIDGYFMKNP